jgi:hypothetical protein
MNEGSIKFIERSKSAKQQDQQQTEKELTIGHLECTINVQTRWPSYYD